MEPSKGGDAAVDLVDVVLREGVVVQADVVVSVADVPMLGVNLRAAVAGMDTMTDYGLFEEWDATIRERARDDGEASDDPPAGPRPVDGPSPPAGERADPDDSGPPESL